MSQACEGSTDIPPHLSTQFEPVTDPALLNEALGAPNEGELCQGQVYVALEETRIQIYRAWNSTNPGSRLGNWWAFDKPSGRVADYREDYEICYQWSPLDKMVSCTLTPGTKVVVGNGQSAQCSQYLTYPVSAEQQVYIDEAAEAVANCADYDGMFSWEAVE
ncbi:hypothetical protein GCM10007392_46530 [Saccharospirillum salsuginis]|uniref:Uncharacterized protein n=1 Tax=Saccharospirillum salsuginis TaxID=418750 RepID=A0A918KTH7_9GAMM|nr:hypothetical protein GCM10007392_46530 [Saccharospirillum salsuginis]